MLCADRNRIVRRSTAVLVDVDRLGMNGGKRGREIDLTYHLWLAIPFSARINDHEIVGRYRARG